MYSKKFEKAFQYVIQNEGDYVFDKNDWAEKPNSESRKEATLP